MKANQHFRKYMRDDDANMAIGSLILALVFVLIGVIFYPIINAVVNSTTLTMLGDDPDRRLLELVPTLFLLIIVAGVAGSLYVGFRSGRAA